MPIIISDFKMCCTFLCYTLLSYCNRSAVWLFSQHDNLHTTLRDTIFSLLIDHRVASEGGRGNLPTDPVFSPRHQNCLEFWNTSMTFPRYILSTEPQKNFSHNYVTVPQILGVTEGTPDGEKLVLSVTRVSAADGKIWRLIHVFMCSQTSDCSADFYWRHI